MAKPRSKKRVAAVARAATKTSPYQPEAARRSRPMRSPRQSKRLQPRGQAILSAAVAAGYLSGEKTERIGGRVTVKLLSAAKARSGLTSQTELLEYALSMVALGDRYGTILLSMKGSILDDVEL